MLKNLESVLMMIADLVSPAILMLMVMAAYCYFQDGNTLGGITCIIGSMIPTMVIYTRHVRENDYIEEYEEENEE
jgi:hypothetical protein